MRKKIFMAGAALCALGFVFASGGAANAQLFTYTGTSTAPSSTVTGATTTASSTATSSASSTPTSSMTGPAPVYATTTGTTTTSPTAVPSGSAVPLAAGYLQLDGLTVTGVSAAGTVPMQIVATAPAGGASCEQFPDNSSADGTSVACPVPAAMMTPTSSTSSPSYYNPYVIVVDPASQVETSDRASTTVATIMPGDTINAYGYYNGTGTLDAEVVRDLSHSSADAAGGVGTEASEIASLQAQLSYLETLVMQFAAQLGLSTSTMASSTLPVSCPMIPAGATSTAGCPPASSTSTPTSTVTPPIYE